MHFVRIIVLVIFHCFGGRYNFENVNASSNSLVLPNFETGKKSGKNNNFLTKKCFRK